SSYCSGPLIHRHPFPTRRSSDLDELAERWENLQRNIMEQFLDMPVLTQPAAYLYNERIVGLDPGTVGLTAATAPGPFLEGVYIKDRKSTRLNSSHVKISYAVFCL